VAWRKNEEEDLSTVAVTAMVTSTKLSYIEPG